MNHESKDSADWQPCEAGFLVGLSRRAKSAHSRRIAARSGLIGTVAVVAIGLGLWGAGMRPPARENYFGGIACHEVRENMPAMMAGAIPDELRARIDAHLLECSACSELMRKMSSGQAATRSPHDHWAGDCPECQRLIGLPKFEPEGAVGADRAVSGVFFRQLAFADFR